jgi:hypothetical protein
MNKNKRLDLEISRSKPATFSLPFWRGAAQFRTAALALALTTLTEASLYAQCSTNNSLCVGASTDCQGALFATSDTSFEDGTIEWFDGKYRLRNGTNRLGSFNTSTQYSGTIAKNTNLSYVRWGTTSLKHSIWKPDTGDTARAEMDDGGMNQHPRRDASGNDYYYWYGWSLYIPNDSNWSSATLNQFLGQWRFYNLDGCRDMFDCTGARLGGSGHHLLYKNGKLRFVMTTLDTSCTGNKLKATSFDLGEPFKGQWMDFVMTAKWTPNSDGKIKIWIQSGASTYYQKMSYTGPTWINKYNNVSTCGVANQEVTAPNWTVGLYWANERPATESTARWMYSDQARSNRTLCSSEVGSEAWKRTLPFPAN